MNGYSFHLQKYRPGRKGTVAGEVQVGNRETAERLPERDRCCHPQSGKRRTVV